MDYFFEDIDDDFAGNQLGVGDIVEMLENPSANSKKRKKRRNKTKVIVFENEIDEEEYTYYDTAQPDSLPDPGNLDFVDSIAREVGEITQNYTLNESLEKHYFSIVPKKNPTVSQPNICLKTKAKSSKNKKNVSVQNSLNQKETSSGSKNSSKKTDRGTSASKMTPTLVTRHANEEFNPKTATTYSKVLINSPSKSTTKKKNPEKYIPGSYNREFKLKDEEFPSIR